MTRSPSLTGVVLSALVAGGLVVASVMAFMPSSVTVTSTVAGSAQPIDGAALFRTKGCSSCHRAAGSESEFSVAPDLVRLADRAGSRVEGLDAEQYVRASIRTPQAYVVDSYGAGVKMPILAIDAAELDALVAYLLER